ncbi:MAG: hypothetical protein EOS54_09995 [Mesorhizobium sp.]|uniref:hypothetical protein n=1 Tax=unclassified Mesorhizobium TaxID=325217 RepID=UPI000F758F4C|nr:MULTISPECIES: hypothetical protein [unclassified Mesorhizobium]RVC42715.1 hypothetical protein EN781_21180 [Mesorhizobium sp. M4A.F.Ca.ET.090.04.2.1]AZO47747.1 hypothetical protein EJ073_07840 [Mesorhizobium sp. M4B.F.Ca.ET.058.02.1.1]RWC54648.1 MAG: hypothetical protein EOS54_09995 [Mesorhizobium sp.]RWD13082.1 MAG: hypothetical protein EOS74_19905 [Mesorhizobium sp.]RWD53909.1 MAG: hypothetical protein EOS75_24465 [Mesorhizobium sp.]
MTEPPELQRLIDDCYDAFAPCPPPRVLRASPLRDPVAILKTLTSAPLRELTGEQIGPYAGWAITTVGDVADYKHFLPRILELAVFDQRWHGLDPPIIASKLSRGGWRTWPRDERAAVQALFAGAWRHGFEQHPDDGDPTGWLCGIAIAGGDLDAALEAWLSSTSANAALHLAEFFGSDAERLIKEKANRNFWNDAGDDTIEKMRRWLLSEPVLDRLLSASVRPEEQWRIDSALLILDAVTQERHG